MQPGMQHQRDNGIALRAVEKEKKGEPNGYSQFWLVRNSRDPGRDVLTNRNYMQ